MTSDDALEPLTPAEGIERFLDYKEPSVRPTTLQNARTRLAWFQEWCDTEGDVDDLNDLTGRHMAALVNWRRSQVKPITVQKQLTTIRNAVRFWEDIEACREGLSEKIHAPQVKHGDEAKDVHLTADRAELYLDELDRYHYASRRHVILALLWATGMRRGALHSLDEDDLDRSEHVAELRHRPDEGTKLKNGERGERDVYLGPVLFELVDDYLDHPDRPDVTDDYGREPLLTTRQGRASAAGTIFSDVHKATQPCRYGDCPHGRDPEDCEAVGAASTPAKCPSSVGPHAVRRGRITHYLNEGVPPDAISKRADVSLEVLERHYDARTKREKMHVRKRFFDGEQA